MNGGEIGGRSILSKGLGLLRRNPRQALAAWLVMTGFSVGGDISSEDISGLLDFAASVASLCFLYMITKNLLAEANLLAGGHPQRGVMALLGLQLLSSIAIGLGLAFLVVPGIYLMVRYFAAVPILLAEDVGVIGSLRQSWNDSSGRTFQILPAVAAIYLPAIAITIVFVALAAAGHVTSMLSMVLNGAINASLIIGWHAAVAFYALDRRGETLVDVFA